MNSQAFAFIAVIIACVLAFGTLTVGQIQNSNDLKDLVNRVAVLNQNSCEAANIARVRSNHQIRAPLKRLLVTFANLSKQGLRDAETPAERARIQKFVTQFEEDAAAVSILRPIPCEFVPD